MTQDEITLMMDEEALFSLPLPLVEHMSHTPQEMCAIMNEACLKPSPLSS